MLSKFEGLWGKQRNSVVECFECKCEAGSDRCSQLHELPEMQRASRSPGLQNHDQFQPRHPDSRRSSRHRARGFEQQ